ncbi:MAG: energy transducer TonB [Flavobacteriales bacterium]|nr:energy transducer TonB [Flavobacteriales bacterium]
MRLLFGIFLALMSPRVVAGNDPLDWSELQRLYACDLAIDARYVREDKAHLWVKVVAVLRDLGYSIVQGDHIRVDKMASTDCGYAWNIGKERRWRFYLQKEEGKGHWALLQRSTGSAIDFFHDRALLQMPAAVELSIAEFDRCMIEFQTCYASADSGNTFSTLCDQARIDSLARGNAIIAQFEKQGHSVTAAHLFEPPEVPVQPAPPPVIRDCALLEQPPRKLGATSDDTDAPFRLSVLDPTPDSLASRTILRVLVDVDGHIRDATVVRASTPQRDGAALRAVGDLPALEPGRQNGVPTACYEVFPIRFILK